MSTDPISDFLTIVRNAVKSGKSSAFVPYSKVKENIASSIVSAGFFKNYRVDRSDKFPVLHVVFSDNKKINNLHRISKCGRRVYISSVDIKRVKYGFGISLISTSQGIMLGDIAKEKGLGGEIICEVY